MSVGYINRITRGKTILYQSGTYIYDSSSNINHARIFTQERFAEASARRQRVPGNKVETLPIRVVVDDPLTHGFDS